jgi:putative MATE family efflux protein
MQMTAALVGITDTLLAGNLPKPGTAAALDGISFGVQFMWITTIVLAGLGVGTQAIVARGMGSGNTAEASRAGGNGVVASLVAGALGGVVVWFLAPFMGTLVGLTPEANEHSTLFVRVVALSMPAMGVMTVGGMTLHGAGETFKPSAIAVGVNVVNVLCSWALSGVVVSLGDGVSIPNPSPLDPAKWGVFGIAAGTGMSYLVGGWFTWRAMHKGVKDFRTGAHELRYDRQMMRRIAVLGLPNVLEGATLWLTTSIGVAWFIGQVAVAEGGANGPEKGLMGAHLIAVRWEAFSFLPGFAMGTAAGALAGQYLGAGSPAMAKRATWACLWVGMAIMGLLGVAFMLFGGPLARLMTDDEVAVREVPRVLFICGFVQIPFAMGLVCRQALRGCGDTRWTFIITFVSMVFVRLPLAWLFGVALGLGLAGIWIGLCIELTVRGILFMSRFLWGRWTELAV